MKIRNDINGWLVVDKPEGMSSGHVVAFLKHLTHPQKIGHGGTLDPLASGVLPIAFGKATRTVEYVMQGLKKYEFTISFGKATSTDDREGDVIKEMDYLPSKDEIKQVLPKFVGDILQKPPAYSALKINGKRAYDLARKGQDVELKQRQVHIESLNFLGIKGNEASFAVLCGKGTYVRSLARDIAESLSSCGHVSFLRRTQCAAFDLKDSFSLEKIKEMCYNQKLQECLFSLETVLSDILELAVNEEEAKKLAFGQSFYIFRDMEEKRIYKAMFEGSLIAFVMWEDGKIRPVKVFKQFN